MTSSTAGFFRLALYAGFAMGVSSRVSSTARRGAPAPAFATARTPARFRAAADVRGERPRGKHFHMRKGPIEIREASGKLGVLLPGMGAVATTFVAGVEMIRRGKAKPV